MSLPRLSFDHYVASEVNFDGGNVKVSVNGGAFALVPADAWLYNAPGGQARHGRGGQHRPDGRPAGLHRHRRRPADRFLGLVGHQPRGAGEAGRQGPVPLRLRHGRLQRHRRLVHRQRRAEHLHRAGHPAGPAEAEPGDGGQEGDRQARHRQGRDQGQERRDPDRPGDHPVQGTRLHRQGGARRADDQRQAPGSSGSGGTTSAPWGPT
ncbi:hypothetical protein G5V59_02075 [Nocardioides sp. W3-2-3]|uniref:hypothetical protein n=1 Tax=Nocardioides convexus TaxID=2712224 RepID=UPI002418A520|nr:hypothetical protein [Nocardioides convexus]NGZ99577.1 hypothetical protein [Nocardioides convexus]